MCSKFFGCNKTPSWPLDEEWSKWTLFLSLPHDGTGIESMKLNGTFRERMEVELTNRHFPVSILSKIIRTRNRATFCVQPHNEVLPPGSNNTPFNQTEPMNSLMMPLLQQMITTMMRNCMIILTMVILLMLSFHHIRMVYSGT